MRRFGYATTIGHMLVSCDFMRYSSEHDSCDNFAHSLFHENPILNSFCHSLTHAIRNRSFIMGFIWINRLLVQDGHKMFESRNFVTRAGTHRPDFC